MYEFHDSTDTLKFWTEKWAINKTFFFHPILMKLGEIVVHIGYYNFTKFHQNQTKTKKVLLIAHFSVQNFKVSVESWKSYIVQKGQFNSNKFWSLSNLRWFHSHLLQEELAGFLLWKTKYGRSENELGSADLPKNQKCLKKL